VGENVSDVLPDAAVRLGRPHRVITVRRVWHQFDVESPAEVVSSGFQVLLLQSPFERVAAALPAETSGGAEARADHHNGEDEAEIQGAILPERCGCPEGPQEPNKDPRRARCVRPPPSRSWEKDAPAPSDDGGIVDSERPEGGQPPTGRDEPLGESGDA
jgi:hypothetical protein